MTAAKTKQAARMVTAGTPLTEVAEVLGVSRTTLYRPLKTQPVMTPAAVPEPVSAVAVSPVASAGRSGRACGRQYRLTVDGEDFFADLLFYHLGLRRYIVFELKVGAAAPAHLGQLNFYVNVIDDLMRRPEHDDGPTIGILLAATRNDVVVEYALRGFDTPLAVSTYRTTAALPEEVRAALPSVEDLTDVVRHARGAPAPADGSVRARLANGPDAP